MLTKWLRVRRGSCLPHLEKFPVFIFAIFTSRSVGPLSALNLHQQKTKWPTGFFWTHQASWRRLWKLRNCKLAAALSYRNCTRPAALRSKPEVQYTTWASTATVLPAITHGLFWHFQAFSKVMSSTCNSNVIEMCVDWVSLEIQWPSNIGCLSLLRFGEYGTLTFKIDSQCVAHHSLHCSYISETSKQHCSELTSWMVSNEILLIVTKSCSLHTPAKPKY